MDYWAIDWDFKNDTFHNQWQAYRTRKDPKIELETKYEYKEAGKRQVVVKVIDILGNDTTKTLRNCGEMIVKPFRWSAHAPRNLEARETPHGEAEQTLNSPERVETAGQRTIYMRRYDDGRLGQKMLIRVVVEEESESLAVITVYITSKIGKCMKGATP